MLFIVNEMETRSKYVSTLKLTQAKFAAARGAPPWLYACLSFFLFLSVCLSSAPHMQKTRKKQQKKLKKKGQKFWSAENGKRQKLVGKIVVFVVGGENSLGQPQKKKTVRRGRRRRIRRWWRKWRIRNFLPPAKSLKTYFQNNELF